MCTVCKTKMMTNKMTIKSFMHRVRKLTSLTCHHPDAKHGAAQYTAQYAAHCTLHMFLTPTNRYHIMGHRVQNNQSNSIAVHYWKRQRVREIREQTSHHVCNLSASSNQASKQVGPKVTVTQTNFLLVFSSKESSHIGNREAYLEPVSYGVDVNRLTHSVLGACWSLPSGPHQIRAGIVIIIVITI